MGCHELVQGEGATPIKQDTKKGKLRFYHEVIFVDAYWACVCRRGSDTHLTVSQFAVVTGAQKEHCIGCLTACDLLTAGDSLELWYAATDLGGA
jgi:hypothetical protein